MKLKLTYTFLLSIIFIGNLFADRYPYRGSVKIIAEGRSHIVYHKHDWGIRLKQMDDKTLTTTADSLESSSITCILKKNGDTLFHKPCPALTSIYFDKKQKYIIGVSNIMVENPYQLYIYDILGNMIKKRGISKKEAKLTEYQFKDFKAKYKSLSDSLMIAGLTYVVDSLYYIDFLNIENDSAWDYLSEFRANNHISLNISGSVSNYIYWYNQDPEIVGFVHKQEYYDPRFKLEYHRKKPFSLTFLDPKKVKTRILITE